MGTQVYTGDSGRRTMIGLTTRRDKVDGTKRMSPGTVPHPPSLKRGSDRGLQSGLDWLLIQLGWLLSVSATFSWNPGIEKVPCFGFLE